MSLFFFNMSALDVTVTLGNMFDMSAAIPWFPNKHIFDPKVKQNCSENRSVAVSESSNSLHCPCYKILRTSSISVYIVIPRQTRDYVPEKH
jgi:hypothetical protein